MAKTKTKRCTKCGEEKPVTEFYKSKKSKDGLVNWDKGCWKQSIADKKARRAAEAAATVTPARKRQPAKKKPS